MPPYLIVVFHARRYVEMQVPVQQPDPYSDNKPKNYQSGAYQPKAYQDGAYDAISDNDHAPAPQRSSYSAPSYSPQPSYAAPAQPSYSAPSAHDLAHEDDDSPFDYLARRGSASTYSGSTNNAGYQAPAYHAPAPAYRPPSPPAYRPSAPMPSYKSNYQPAQPVYRPPAPQPSYGSGQSAAAHSSGGQDYSQSNGKSFFSYNENKGKPYTVSQKPDISIVAGGDGGYSSGSRYSGGNDDSTEVGLT